MVPLILNICTLTGLISFNHFYNNFTFFIPYLVLLLEFNELLKMFLFNYSLNLNTYDFRCPYLKDH